MPNRRGCCLPRGANVNDTAADGNSALVVAAFAGHPEVARVLLDAGADPNAAGAGYSALHAAALRGDLATVKALLAKRRQSERDDHEGQPGAPVWIAVGAADADDRRHAAVCRGHLSRSRIHPRAARRRRQSTPRLCRRHDAPACRCRHSRRKRNAAVRSRPLERRRQRHAGRSRATKPTCSKRHSCCSMRVPTSTTPTRPATPPCTRRPAQG